MVRLKNIEIDDNIAKCNIIPEDSAEIGYVEVDIKKASLLICKLPKGYEWCNSHVSHAVRALVQLSHESTVPSEKLIMWY